MSDCVFCRIVDGDLPSRTVHETPNALAFLDANPLAVGHTLVIPKDHYRQLDDVPPDQAGEMFEALQEVVPAVERAVNAPATTVAFNNGPEAGQEVPHVHAHVVPRWAEDSAGPIHSMFHDRPRMSESESDDVAEQIRSEL